jgi:hypothetical protein
MMGPMMPVFGFMQNNPGLSKTKKSGNLLCKFIPVLFICYNFFPMV